jgi:hypothetical protein
VYQDDPVEAKHGIAQDDHGDGDGQIDILLRLMKTNHGKSLI